LITQRTFHISKLAITNLNYNNHLIISASGLKVFPRIPTVLKIFCSQPFKLLLSLSAQIL